LRTTDIQFSVKDLLSSVTAAKTYSTSSLRIGNVLNIGVLKYIHVASQHCTEYTSLIRIYYTW